METETTINDHIYHGNWHHPKGDRCLECEAEPQPAPNAGREWRALAGPPEYARVVDQADKEAARCYRGTDTKWAESCAMQIIADHNAVPVLVKAAFAALVLCNSLGPKQTKIAYDGRDDFDVATLLREALATVGRRP